MQEQLTQVELPHSPACERNKSFIAEILSLYIEDGGRLLEMGHGTGQHAMFFSSVFPHVQWHAADLVDYHWMLKQRLKLNPRDNVSGPITLEVGAEPMIEQLKKAQQAQAFDYLFTANTLHIMNQKQVDVFCLEVAECLKSQGHLILYGPFKFQDEFTSESNKEFHQSLVSRGVGSGIKEFERLEEQLKDQKIDFVKRFNLPANNQILIFQKR
jgi:ubiquinone/menaquinone biosynthesis C-methylase UbiE